MLNTNNNSNVNNNMNDEDGESMAQKMQLESSLDLLKRLHLKPFKSTIEFIDENMNEQGVIESGTILEIVESADSLNVSDLFVEILIKAILPMKFNNLKLQGNQWNVIYFDLSMSFNPIRLAHRLSKRIDELLFSLFSQHQTTASSQQQSQIPNVSESQQLKSKNSSNGFFGIGSQISSTNLITIEEKKKLIEQCLSRIQICRPKDPLETIATLSNLPVLFHGMF